MRVSRKQVEENRQAILDAAGHLFRERGFENVTVADVMNSAGLTHGGFYGYFKSKDDLIAQALHEVLGSAAEAPDDMGAFMEWYLSPEHRDNFADGCPVAALASETVRQPGLARAEMTAALRRQIDRFARMVPGKDDSSRRQTAIGNWAAMVGALILARMSEDEQLSEEVLLGTRAFCSQMVSSDEHGNAQN